MPSGMSMMLFKSLTVILKSTMTKVVRLGLEMLATLKSWTHTLFIVLFPLHSRKSMVTSGITFWISLSLSLRLQEIIQHLLRRKSTLTKTDLLPSARYIPRNQRPSSIFLRSLMFLSSTLT